jgi:hypothetical protein
MRISGPDRNAGLVHWDMGEPSAMPPRIGRYEIRAELGRGGFARVFRAYDQGMGREVAIKELTQFDEPNAVSRFLAEARTAGNLHHRNIVTIHDSDEHDGKPYIVMELLEGETLKQLIECHAAISLLDKLRIMLQVAEGLAFAHERGVIHRDVKPANIMRLPNGDAKIMDFGIARGLGGSDTRRTLQGNFLGTPWYTAPERFRNIEDAASDVFSYGVVVYEFISGQHPFKAIDYSTLIYKITSCEPEYSLIELVPECPPAVDELVHRALRKDHEMRFQNMGEVVLDLTPIVIELAHEHAGRLTAQVEPLLGEGRMAEAEELLRQARALDPGNKEARRLHETIVQQQRRALLRSRVDALVHDAETKLKERHFNDAIQILTSASRLVPDDEVNAKLRHANEALEANRRAGRLASEAQQQAGAGNIDEAFRLVSSAFSIDPNHPSVAALFRDIKGEVDAREARRRFEHILEVVQNLRSQSEFDRALEVLSAIPPASAGSEVIQRLTAEIEAERNDHAIRMRTAALERAVKKIRALIQASQFEKARQEIEVIRHEFEGASEIADLSSALAAKEADHRRAEQIRKATGTALDLIRARKFADACRVLEEAHKTYAEDTGISRLLEHTRGLRAADDRARAATAALEGGRSLHREGRLEEALQVINQALMTCGDHPDLLELKSQVEFDYEQQQSQAAVHAVLDKANQLLSAARAEEAIAELEQALASFPASDEIIELLDAARRAKAVQEEQEYCADAKSRIRAFESAQDLRSAHKIAKQALENYPDNEDLRNLEKRLAGAVDEELRQLDVDRRAAAIKEKLDSSDWRAAAAALEDALDRYPHEARFNNLGQQIRAAQLRSEMADLERSIREDLRNGELAEAERRLQDAAPHLGEQPAWVALNDEVERQKRYEADLARAERLRNEGDLETAWLVLEDTVSYSDVPDRRREQLRQLVRHELAAKNRRANIDRAVVEVKQKLQEGNLPAARAAIQALDTQARNNSQILALLSRVEQEERSRERDKHYAEALDAAELASSSGDFAKAESILRVWIPEAPDSRAGTLLEFVVAKRKEAERKEHLKRLQESARGWIGKHDYVNAIAELQRARREFPDDTELKRLEREAERRQVVDVGLLKIAEAEEKGDFESALAEAQRILQAAPGEPELENAIERLRSALRDKQLTDYNRKIQEAIQSRDWAKADRLLEAAAREYSGDASLAHLRQLLTAKQRQFALEELLGNVQDCMLRNELELARAALEHGKEAFGSEPAWNALRVALEHRLAYESALRQAEERRRRGDLVGADSIVRRLASAEAPDARASVLLKQILAEQSRKERDEAVRQVRTKAASLSRGGDLDAAIDLLDSAIAQYPSDSGLLEDRRALVLRRETDFANRSVLRIAELQARRDWKAAIDAAEEALKSYPDNTELQTALQRVREASAHEQRRSAVGQLVREIHAAIDARNWSEAEQALKTARRDLPGEGIFDQLAETLTAGRRRADIDAAIEATRGALAANQLDRAARELATGKRCFPEEEAWRTLEEELERYRTYEKALLAARELDRKGKHGQAEELLRDLISKGALDSRAALLLTEVTEHRADRERQHSLLEAKSEAERLEKAGRLPEALGILDRLCAQYPSDTELADQRRRVQARQQQQESEAKRADAERRKAAERVSRISLHREGIEAAIEACDWDKADRLLAEARREFPAEQVFQERGLELQANRRQREIEKLSSSVRAAFDTGDLDSAARQLAAAQMDFAGERAWQELTKELESRRRYAALVAEGQELLATGKESQAAQRFEKAVRAGAYDDRAQSLLHDIRRKIKPRRQSKARILAGVVLAFSLIAAISIVYLVLRPRTSDGPKSTPLPELSYDPTSLSFTYSAESNQPQQGIIRWQGGLARHFRAIPEVDWLTVAPESGQSLETLTVTADGRGLEAGRHEGSILVKVDEEGGRPANPYRIPVTLTKGSEELPAPTPTEITFSCEKGDRSAQHRTLTWSKGAGRFRVRPGAHWLVITPNGGDSLKPLDIALKPEGLPEGPHDSIITVEVEYGSKTAIIQVPVTLNVKAPSARVQPPPPPSVPIQPLTISFNFEFGQSPDAQQLDVKAPVARVVAQTGAKWLLIDDSARDQGRLTLRVAKDEVKAGERAEETLEIYPRGNQFSANFVKVQLTVRERTIVATPVPKPDVAKEIPPSLNPNCDEKSYTGLAHGRLTWIGTLAPGAAIDIKDDHATQGNLKGNHLPGCELSSFDVIEPAEGIKIVERPSRDNGYRRAKLTNTSGSSISTIQILWSKK